MKDDVKIVDVSKDAYLSYRAAIKLATDWNFLAELSEAFTKNPKLSDEEKDDLVRLANEKEREFRPEFFSVRISRKDA